MKINVLLASIQIRGIDGTGGLGDVPVGLSKVLVSRGDVDIRLVMPGFSEISGSGLFHRFEPKYLVAQGVTVPLNGERKRVDVYRINLPQIQQSQQTIPLPDVPCYLLRCPEVFDAPSKYGKDSPTIAIFFARAVLEFLRICEDFRVDLVHCNDWHTALIPVYLQTLYHDDPYLGRVATLYTTHNAEGGFQGSFDEASDLLMSAELQDCNVFTDHERFSLNHFGKFNFCRAGFAFPDLINTVSRQYHKELLTPAFGAGLHTLLNGRQHDFCGIINGIDTTEWDPETDAYISPHNFSVADGPNVIRAKKRRLRSLLRREPAYEKLRDDSVLIGLVSRIDYQKTEILQPIIERNGDYEAKQPSPAESILNLDGDFQLVFLGAPGAKDKRGAKQAQHLQNLASRFSGKLLFYNGFDIPLSHIVYAASEIFVVPSVFEPCGLTQLAAMEYGAVPVVRSVGGLVDTVIDALRPSATGFQFKERVDNPQERMHEERAAAELVSKLREALQLRTENQDRWNELILNGMQRDWSWHVPSMQYVRLYQEAIRRRGQSSFFSGS